MKYALLAASLFVVSHAEARPNRRTQAKRGTAAQKAARKAPKRRSNSAQRAARGAAQAAAGLCAPTITCKVGRKTGVSIPLKSGPTRNNAGKISCRYEIERANKVLVDTRKNDCAQVPVTQCTPVNNPMRVVSASVGYMRSTPQDGKCQVLPRVSLRQR